MPAFSALQSLLQAFAFEPPLVSAYPRYSLPLGIIRQYHRLDFPKSYQRITPVIPHDTDPSVANLSAIDRYDIGKGYEFSSFATPTIIGEIKKYFRDKVWALRVPRRVQELSKKISEAKVALEQENKTHPKVKDIADYIGCSEEEVLEAMEASYGYQPISLDSSSNDDSEDKDITLIDKIGEEESSFNNIEQKDFVNKFMESLNELEVKIFKDRFFLDKTQSTIAKELEISQMTVSRIEKKIVEKLRKEYEKQL